MKILLAAVLLSMLVGAPWARGQTGRPSTPLKAQQLIGLKVEDTDGQKIGTIRNLIIDTGTGELKYAVIGSGGFLGVRSTLRLAPARALSAATTKRETLGISVTMDQWLQAPVFRASRLATLAGANRAREIDRYFEDPDTRAASAASGPLPATGSTAGQTNGQSGILKYASDIIGLRVVNSKQERIGEVLDLLVSMGPPHPSLAILSTGRLFRRGRLFALPLQELKPTGNRGRLRVNLDTNALESAPPFTQQVWDTTDFNSQPVIYNYSKPGE